MNRNARFLFPICLSLVLLLSGSFALAQSGAHENLSTATDVGQPGTVFRYVQTFGETGVPYLADNDHIYAPIGFGLDASGNVWIAEGNGYRAMKYSAGGAFLMSIGTAGISYLADETHFAGPTDVSVDSAGNIWVADMGSARVVKFDPSGSYLMQLGVTSEGGSDNDHLDGPISVAFDSAGNIYVSDSNNQRIQIFNSSGVYSTTIGMTDQTGSGDYQFNYPARIAIDADDNLYVADINNHRVQIYNASHVYVATLGVTGEPGSDNDHFNGPRGVAVDSSYIYVADRENHRVQIFNRTTRTYEDTLGSYGSGNYQFDTPRDVAVDGDFIYIADAENHRVQQYRSSDLVYTSTFGVTRVPYLTDDLHYNQPSKIAVDANGNIGLLEDEGRGHRFIKLDPDGVPLFTIGEAGIWGWDNEHFSDARGVTFDEDGNIYIGDCANHRVQIFTSSGVYSETLGSGYGQGDDQFFCPTGVTFDDDGNFYVVDSGNQRLQIFDSSLTYSATLGVTGEPGLDNDHFANPRDVGVDASGNIYIADTDNHRVQKFDSGLAWQMTLGVTGECINNTFDHLCSPMGLAVDAADNLYVAEYWNPRVQVFDPNGAYLTTIGGAWGDLSSQFRNLLGVAVDDAGNVYIPDMANHRLQKFSPGVPGWQQVNINGFGNPRSIGVTALSEFDGRLYAGAANFEAGGQIYRSDDGVDWVPVTEPGFGEPYTRTIPAIIDLTVFQGQLYAGAGWGGAGYVWRSPDGTTWEPVITDGFGDGSNVAVTTFAVFNDLLFAGTGNSSTGAQIWRSASGNSSEWVKVAPDESGTDDTTTVTSFAVFKGSLYAAVESEEEGAVPAQVWRSSNGSAWDTVIPDGFGDTNNYSTGGFANYGGYLYLGMRNRITGPQLWRSSDGTNWEQVVIDGFGDSNNFKLERLFVFASWLYAGVDNGVTGLEMWRSKDATNWEQVNPDGFGDSNNGATLWNNAYSEYQNQFYMGTFNSGNGGELWRYNLVERNIYLPLAFRQEPLTLRNILGQQRIKGSISAASIEFKLIRAGRSSCQP